MSREKSKSRSEPIMMTAFPDMTVHNRRLTGNLLIKFLIKRELVVAEEGAPSAILSYS